jgi:hypothetical protein
MNEDALKTVISNVRENKPEEKKKSILILRFRSSCL